MISSIQEWTGKLPHTDNNAYEWSHQLKHTRLFHPDRGSAKTKVKHLQSIQWQETLWRCTEELYQWQSQRCK